MKNKRRIYSRRKGVDWYEGGMPIHNQKRKSDGMYWNEIRGEWCVNKCDSKMLEVGEIRVLDFKCYPLSKIKEEFGAKMYERVGFFITKLYGEHLLSIKGRDWEFEYWNNKKLELILGRDNKKVIEGMVAKKIIEIKKMKGLRGNVLCSFKLNKMFKRERYGEYKEEYIKGGVLTKALKRNFKKQDVKNQVLKYIKEVVLNSSLEIDDLDSLIDKMWLKKLAEYESDISLEFIPKRDKNRLKKICSEPSEYEKEYKVILSRYYEFIHFALRAKCIEEKNALCYVRKSDFGYRISHLFSNTPKDYRKYLKIKGSEVVEVDIKASQPSFLFYMMENLPDVIGTKAQLFDIPLEYTHTGELLAMSDKLDLYKFMAFKMYGLGWAKERPNARMEMKNLFYRLVYGDPKYKVSGIDRKELVVKTLGKEMYEFIEQMSKIDLGLNQKDKYKQLVALLQKIESTFLLAVMKEHMKRKIPFLPLYDSMIVRKQDETRTRKIMVEVIRRNSLNGYLKIK